MPILRNHIRLLPTLRNKLAQFKHCAILNCPRNIDRFNNAQRNLKNAQISIMRRTFTCNRVSSTRFLARVKRYSATCKGALVLESSSTVLKVSHSVECSHYFSSAAEHNHGAIGFSEKSAVFLGYTAQKQTFYATN